MDLTTLVIPNIAGLVLEALGLSGATLAGSARVYSSFRPSPSSTPDI